MKNSRESYMDDGKDPMHNMAPDLLKSCQHYEDTDHYPATNRR
jgi:hypothetical protein